MAVELIKCPVCGSMIERGAFSLHLELKHPN